jgi:hypothetical protein
MSFPPAVESPDVTCRHLAYASYRPSFKQRPPTAFGGVRLEPLAASASDALATDH